MEQLKTFKQNAKFSKFELKILRYLSRKSAIAYNLAIESIEDYYAKHKSSISKYDNFEQLFEAHKNGDFKFINSGIVIRSIFQAHNAYSTFFGLQKKGIQGASKPKAGRKYGDLSFEMPPTFVEKSIRKFNIPQSNSFRVYMSRKIGIAYREGMINKLLKRIDDNPDSNNYECNKMIKKFRSEIRTFTKELDNGIVHYKFDSSDKKRRGRKTKKEKEMLEVSNAVDNRKKVKTVEKIDKFDVFENIYDIEHDYNDILKISIPSIIKHKTIKEVKIRPVLGAKRFEIIYVYVDDEEPEQVFGNEVMGIDFGIDNLMTCADTLGGAFIIDGRRLKSLNQGFNKEVSRLKSKNQHVLKKYKDKNGNVTYKKELRKNLKPNESYKYYTTKRIDKCYTYRNNAVHTYVCKATKLVIDHAIKNGISTIVLGYNENFSKPFNLPKDYPVYNNMEKCNAKRSVSNLNQTFLSIPFGKIKNRLAYLCERHGITFIIQEESYTSKASFFDNDAIPVYVHGSNATYSFSGTRVHRGLYIDSKGRKINADYNAALNIMRKSKQAGNMMPCLSTSQHISLLRRGPTTPVRLLIK